MPTVLLGISSGIAAYKMLTVIELLRQEKIVGKTVDIHVIMTRSATRMVEPTKLEVATGHKVWVELFEQDFDPQKALKTRQVDHIRLAEMADVMVVAPATANTLAKLAHGLADDFLTTTALAVHCPVLLFPSMNTHMWQHPATQRNVAQLQADGCLVCDPASGLLACGTTGPGRLPEPSQIVEAIVAQLARSQQLAGKRVLITLGGTQEKIDEVRFLTNHSTGKMGAALADACWQAGAEVTVLASATAVAPRFVPETKILRFTTADELADLLKAQVKHHDVLFHVAAVSDFRVEELSDPKLSSHQSHTLTLKPHAKILDQIKTWNPKLFLIAFKAEAGITPAELVKKAQQRLDQSRADAIIANVVGLPDGGFAADSNEVWIVRANQKTIHLPLTSKRELARQIVEKLVARALVSKGT